VDGSGSRAVNFCRIEALVAQAQDPANRTLYPLPWRAGTTAIAGPARAPL